MLVVLFRFGSRDGISCLCFFFFERQDRRTSRMERPRLQCDTVYMRTVDSTPHTSLFLCTMRVLNNVLHNTLAQVSARARLMPSTWSSTLCGCPFFDSLFLALFVCVFLLSLLLLPEP